MNDLKTKEEILQNLKPVNGFLKKVDISKAMDIWADQQAKKEAIAYEKEIERLKALIKKLWNDQYPNPEMVQDIWQQFKTENNL